MRLPNGPKAVVDMAKLRDYCLSPVHPEGRHKARVFRAALGLTRHDAGELHRALLVAAEESDAIPAEADAWGKRFNVDFGMTHGDRQAVIRSAWIVLRGEDYPRLLTCYVLE